MTDSKTTYRKQTPNDPLDAAREDLARLKGAKDWEEQTGKTEVHVHVPQPSQPDTESLPEKAAGATREVLDGVNSWQKVAALLILVAGLLIGYWMRGH